jgi:hypothetical protein
MPGRARGYGLKTKSFFHTGEEAAVAIGNSSDLPKGFPRELRTRYTDTACNNWP